MKKSLLALAVLGAYAGVASAQSSVTIFGVVDLSINNVKNGSLRTTEMASNQLNSNRFGLRGFEDLGGGLGAGFWLEAGMNNGVGDAGGGSGNVANVANTAPSSQLFNRRSTVSLFSQAAGEVRLGRDYTPTFWNLAYFDVYGANGIGNDTNMISLAGPTTSTAGTGVRANNSVGYHLPGNLGGFYGQGMYALGQGNDNNKYWGLRGGFATGPFDVALAYGETTTVLPEKLKVTNIGGSWNFGFLKMFLLWNNQKFGGLKEDYWGLGASLPLGQGEFKAMYGSVKDSGTQGAVTIRNADATTWSLQYIYNLSKRTALYGGYASIDNDPNSFRTVLGGSIGSTAASLAGKKSDAFNVGVRHSF